MHALDEASGAPGPACLDDLLPNDVLTVRWVARVDERRFERWVCHPCFEDFATKFGWVLATG